MRGLSLVTVLLSVALLVFGWSRINAYIDVYGYTHRRLWVQAFMPWMVVLFVGLVLQLFHLRRNIFSTGMLVAVIGYLVTMNLLNINAFVAERNIDRYLSGEHELDLCYLLDLSADAVPEMLHLADTTPDATIKRAVGRDLLATQRRLNAPVYENVFAYNVTNRRVRSLLDEREPELQTYVTGTSRRMECVVEPSGVNLARR